MTPTVQITFRDMKTSAAVTEHVERRAAKLETFFDRLQKLHVVVEEPHRHARHGQKFHVRVDMSVPGRDLLVASKTPEDAKENAHVAIDDAFDDAERILEAHARSTTFQTKTHLRSPHGVVGKIFHDRGYGFIEADGDGHEVYFHRNSVVDEVFDKVAVGHKVRFAEEDGDKGPQASTVHVLKH